MYQLTLTADERRAIDWVGNRYAHGNDLYSALCDCPCQTPEDADWDADCDITYHVPEHVAWAIGEVIDADNLACFGDGLREKLYRFQGQII